MRKFLTKVVGLTVMVEGIAHVATAVMIFWGMWATDTWDWRLIASGSIDFLFSFSAIAAGILLGQWNHHGHGRDMNE